LLSTVALSIAYPFAEFERSLIIDRTKKGREAAVARGVKFGPRPILTEAQISLARSLIDQEGRTVKEAADLLGVHRSTIYRAFDQMHS
jgi:DNA invertase Pin-like site-specific DNA recombinase